MRFLIKTMKLSQIFSLVLLCTAGNSRIAQADNVDVVTFHNDNARLGWNAHETVLTPTTLKSGGFGKVWQAPLDGMVHGSPLYLSNIQIGGKQHDVLFAGTDSNSVYALDAATGTILWKHQQLVPQLSDPQFTGSWGWGKYSKHGILSTPVIDSATGTLYTCTIRAQGLKQVYQVWALDIKTGELKQGWPATIKGKFQGMPFVAGQVMQRGALIVVNGKVYVPFGGRGDSPPWRGWLVGVDCKNPQSPQQAFCSSPVTDGAGIWSGGGVAASAGDIFASTGNGDYDFTRGGSNFGESVLRLKTDANSLLFTRKAPDFYTPANYKQLDEQDEDLGGATANLLPELPGSKVPHLLFIGGKDGLAYLLDRDNLGGIGGEVQKMRLFGNPSDVYHEGIRSTSAYYDAGTAGRFIFVAGDNPGPNGEMGITALQIQLENGVPHFKPVWTQKKMINGPSSPIVTSNGATDGIVWVVETENQDHSTLYAFDPVTGSELYSSDSSGEKNRFEGGRRFTSPIATNGRVFIGAQGVYCYGLTKSASSKEEDKKEAKR